MTTKETHGQKIKDIQVGKSVVLEQVPAGGSLEARRLRSGDVMFYWRYTEDRRTERVPLGTYDSSAPPKSLRPTARGYSVAAALEAARDHAKRNADTPGGLRAQRAREAAEQEAAKRAAIQAQRHTLKALCEAYQCWLEKQEKWSAREVRNIFTKNLYEAFPETAAKPAATVTKREVVVILRSLSDQGKLSTARKLRSYLRAAYECAVKADSDATLPSEFIEFGVTGNPVESTAAIHTESDKNPLSADELRAYWKALADEPGVIGAALRLHVLTGAQRPTQLARIRRDADVSETTLRLLDPKGKRRQPRPHLLPITPRIRQELDLLPAKGYILSTDGGETQMHPTSLSAWSSDVGKRAKIAGFQMKRVRSGVETLLAAAGVSKDIRGQLQSHGIGGVQDTHYDAHEYLGEKERALTLLLQLLERRADSKSRASNRTPEQTESSQSSAF